MAHSNTLFAQVLRFVCGHDFSALENGPFKPKRKFRTLTRRSQFTAMVLAHLTGRTGLRGISGQLALHGKRLYHLGISLVKRSTLSDANATRDPAFFEALFEKQYQRCRAIAPGHDFKFKNRLYSFDASVVDLCLGLFPWARFRKSRGGVKLHTLLDHDGLLPAFVKITEAKVHEVNMARTLTLPGGSIVAFDRGMVDYAWFNHLNQKNIFFVTRAKRNMRHKVVARRKVLKQKGLTCDQTILLTGARAKDCPIPLRRVGFVDKETGKRYVFLTNNFKLAAATIAGIYRERWKIELFFKWIKQNLKIKKFYGTNKNSVLTQIWIGMITMLILAFLKFLAKTDLTLSQILSLLQLNLFIRQDLDRLLHPPPILQETISHDQLSLNFRWF